VNRNLQRTYRQVLYSLKKQYGDTITVCQNITASTNYITGAKSYTCSRTKINKAILLPTNIGRKTDYKLPMMSANKMFIFGATFDVGSKIIVIDIRDVPTYFELSMDDWILIENERYEITGVEELEYHAGWVLGLKRIIGASADLEVALSTSDSMSISGDGSENKEAERTITSSIVLSDSESENKEAERTVTSSLGISDANSYEKI